MKIIYIAKYNSKLKKVFKKLNLNIEFIDNTLDNKFIKYSSDNDFIKRSEKIKPILQTLIKVIKDNLNIKSQDIISPDFAVEGGPIYYLQELFDKEHLFEYINNNPKNKVIIVRQLIDLFYLRKRLRKEKININVFYLPSIQSISSFVNTFKYMIILYIRIIISCSKKRHKLILKQDIFIDIQNMNKRRLNIYSDLIKAINKTGKSFAFLSTNNQKSIKVNGREYKSINILKTITLKGLIDVYKKNIINLYKIIRDLINNEAFHNFSKLHLIFFTIFYVLIDIFPRIEFNKEIKNICLKKKNLILFPFLDLSSYSRIIVKNFRELNKNINIIRLPFHDFPFFITNPFYDFYSTDYDYEFMYFPSQINYAKNIKIAKKIIIGLPQEFNRNKSLLKNKKTIVIDISAFGNGYYTPESIEKLIQLIISINQFIDFNFFSMIILFHPSCKKEYSKSIANILSKEKNIRIFDQTTNSKHRKDILNNSDFLICFASSIGLTHLLNKKPTIIFKQIINSNFDFINKIYKNSFDNVKKLSNVLEDEFNNLIKGKTDINNCKFSELNDDINQAIISPEKHISNISIELLKILQRS